MNSYNKGIFTIGELKTYTMNPLLSYEMMVLPRKSKKSYKITSRTYRRWAREQRRTLKYNGMKSIRSKRPGFMDNSYVLNNSIKRNQFTKEEEQFILSTLKPKTKRSRRHRRIASNNYTGRV